MVSRQSDEIIPIGDIAQSIYSYPEERIRVTGIITGEDGNVAIVTPDGSLQTTSTTILSGDVYLKVDQRDGLCEYGEIQVDPNIEGTIVSISVVAGEKVNIMAATMQGTGIGDFKVVTSAGVKARKVDLNPVDFNFGFNGITVTGPDVVSIKVTNSDVFYNGPRYNKTHSYFGSLLYTVEPVS
jgi:hypothetical protein